MRSSTREHSHQAIFLTSGSKCEHDERTSTASTNEALVLENIF
jgi:hypothetical protein